MIKAIIFDFDNTLEDFASVVKISELAIAKYLHKKHNINPNYFVTKFNEIDLKISHIGAIYKDIRVYDRKYWFKEFFELTGMKIKEKEIHKLVKMYWKIINTQAKLLPGAISTLKYAKKKYKIIILSDSDGERKLKIDRIKEVGILKLADLIIIGNDVNTTKPDIKFYDYILKRMNLKSSECLMVGDKPEVDLKLAKKLGMKTAWIMYGSWADKLKGKHFNYVDYKIKHFKQLKEII